MSSTTTTTNAGNKATTTTTTTTTAAAAAAQTADVNVNVGTADGNPADDNNNKSTPLIVPSKTCGIKVDAANIAKPFRDEIKAKVQKLKESGIESPLLVGLLANNDPAAQRYAEWTARACRADGLRYELRPIPSPLDVERALVHANDDPRVHGIIVYYPVFGMEETYSGASQDDYLRDSISHRCDVEGLCHSYRMNLYRNVRFLDYPNNTRKCLLPCTALAVVKILEQCPGCYDRTKPLGKHMDGQVVTVINRSEIVGRPLAAMLANDGADVYSIDINSIYLFRGGRLFKCDEGETPESCVKKSSVVVTGVPTKSYRLPTEWIKPNTTVINVASYKNVDEESLLKIPGVVYVPMVGKVTVAMLERNLMRLFENFHHPDRRLLSDLERRGREGMIIPWYGSPLQLYTAVAVTAMLALMITRK